MDSDPLVPKEVSQTKKLLMYALGAALAIYMLVAVVLIFVEARQDGKSSCYFAAVSLIFLIVAVVLVNLWMPQDFMETKAKYGLLALNVCLFLVATSMMAQSLIKTPCPVPNTCTLGNVGEGQWLSSASKMDCFPTPRNTTYILLSANKTCPEVPPAPFEMLTEPAELY